MLKVSPDPSSSPIAPLQKLGLLAERWLTTNTLLLAAGLALALGVWALVSRAPLVDATSVFRGDAAEVVYATGEVEPVHWAKITSLHRKRIVELCKCEGEAVLEGDVLVRLDDGEEKALLGEIEARLERLRADAERLRRLVDRNVAAQTTYDEKLTQIREHEARLAAQKDRIGDLVLRAPMDGVILRRDGEVGEIAGAGGQDAILWVGRPRPLRVAAEVNEEDITAVRPGQRVYLRHDGHSGPPLLASVDRITPKGDPETKTFRVYLSLPDETPLMIGMSVEANIVVRETQDALLAPAEAVADGKVQAVEGGVVRWRTVETGVRGGAHAELRSGAAEGDLLLTPPRLDLKDGARVRIAAPEQRP